MATAKPDGPLRRIGSFELIPPDMSELRVILLGNSWSQNCFVGNLLLERDDFDSKRKAGHCRISASLQDKNIVIVNTPDLLQLDFTANKLSELVSQTVTLSAPGPHVFLLVLQPENFTEQHKTRLESVLKHFREQAFEHSLVLICSPQTETLGFMDKYMSDVQIRDVIIKCRYRYLWMTTTKEDEEMKNFKRKVLLTRISWMMNSEEHLKHQVYEEAQANTEQTALTQGTSDVMSLSDERGASLRSTVPYTPAIRVVLFGKNDDKKTKIVNILSGNQALHSSSQHCVATCCYVNGKPLTVVTAPDLYSLKEHEIKQEIRNVVSLCSPGPNVLLLLVKPSEFTEENRKTLNFIMSLFGPNAFKHAMVVITHKAKEKYHDHVENIISDCKRKFYNMFEENHQEFKATIENIIQQNKRSFLTVTEEIHTEVTYLPPLKLVLCGSSAAEKSSVVQSMFGGAELTAVSSPGQCVPHQGEVCGRWVSLVELPALSGKPLETVMQQSLSCISLCAPEGVHAFILVLPVGPLTDEDQAELDRIRDTFGSRVRDFTVVLFTDESDSASAVNFSKETRVNVEEVFGGTCLCLNIRDKEQVLEVIKTVDSLTEGGAKAFTNHMFVEAQIETVIALKRSETPETRLSPMGLRLVLIGKTGSGKSATANTILRASCFKPKVAHKKANTSCEKASGSAEGRTVTVVNTPPLFDQSFNSEELSRCFSLLAPGPHAFLLLLPIGNISKDDRDSLELVKKMFTKKAVDLVILVFTRGDQLENLSLEKYIQESDGFIKDMLKECQGRCQVFNNKDETDRSQVQELLRKIDKMLQMKSGLTQDMFEMERKEEKAKLQHERTIKDLSNQISECNKRLEQRDRQLKEKDEKMNQERQERRREQEEEAKRCRRQEEAARQETKRKLDEAERKIRAEAEERRRVERQLEQQRRETERKRQDWDRERKDIQESRFQELRQNLDATSESYRQLQEEFIRKRKKWTYILFVTLLCSAVMLCYLVITSQT